jgi:ferredoxin
MKGVRFLEKFYREPFVDETVIKKIEKTTFISLGCNQPFENCFCVCCDGGPFLTEGPDIQMIDLGDRFLLETFTQKGDKFLSSYKELLKPADEEDMKLKNAIVEEVDSKFEQRSYMSMGIKDMSLDKVPDEVWEFLNNRCLSCGSCTYVCPTCSCFNVYDLKTQKGGKRIRTWDSCNYAGFTREVSGHNPRPDAKERLKRRFFHKLSYQCLRNNGRIGCVGCGRCTISCPSLLGMSAFVTTLRETRTWKRDE